MENTENDIPTKLSRKRWLVVFLFLLYTFLSTVQYTEYSIITNVIAKYYDVSTSDVYWTTIVFMLVWPILFLPASFIVHRKGLRTAALIGATATCLGAVIKVFAVRQDLFFLVLIGQTFTAISQLFILNIPPKIASTWFDASQASTICSIGIFGMTCGSAVGFVAPPMIVKDSEDFDEIGSDLNIMCWSLVIMCVPTNILVYLYFPDQPAKAPSVAQHHRRQENHKVTLGVYYESLKVLFGNKLFLLHVLAFGCNFGIFGVMGTLLNQLVLSYFEGAQEDAGRMGLVMILLGMPATLIMGILLDRTHKYKEFAVTLGILCIITMGGFFFALEMRSKVMSYVTIGIFGIALHAYMPVGFELGIELTYPSPESTVNATLLATSQIFATVFTIACGNIIATCGNFYGILAEIGIFAVGLIITCVTPNRLNRQDAHSKGTLPRNATYQIVNLEEP